MTRLPRKWKAAACLAACGAACAWGVVIPQQAAAQAPNTSAIPPAAPTWYQAIVRTHASGTPTLLIITSSRVPASKELLRTLSASPLLARLKDRLSLAELSAEADPREFQNLHVGCPAIIAFRRSASGTLERVATYPGAMGPEGVVGWLVGLQLIGPDSFAATMAQAPVPPTILSPASAPALAPRPTADPAVAPAGFGYQYAPQPSPQQPMPAPPVMYAPPPPPREVVVERPAPRRVVREAAPRRREVVVEREVIVEREAAPREREVVIEREAEPAPTPRNILTRPREVVIEREAAPREVVREIEVAPREVVVEREVEAAPRRVVQAAPREVAFETTSDAQAPLTIVQPGLFDRFVGALGTRMAQRGRARAYLDVETQKVYRAAAPAPTARCLLPTPIPCATPTSCAPPPAYGPSPQSIMPPPPVAPSPQYYPGG